MTRQVFQYDPAFGYRFIPGVKARVEHEGGGYLLRANRAGFRCDREVVPAKPPGSYRILLFGDSYTAGDGVSNKHRFGDVLEQLVPGIEVLNFGLPGSGTDQQYLIYREVAPAIEHDLVVIAVLVENIRRVVARFRPYQSPDGQPIVLAKPYFTLAGDGALNLHNVPVPKEPLTAESVPLAEREHVDQGGRFLRLRELVNRAGPTAKDWVQRLTRFQPLPAYARSDDPAWRLMRAILERWLGEIKTPVLICPLPLYQYVEGTSSPKHYLARFAELADPPRVRIHDPLPDLWRYPRQQRRGFRFGDDPHPTPAGHRAIAESLARPLRALLEVGTHGMSVTVLGISAFYHDSAAALVRDGEIVAAAQEERFSRKKHDPRFPRHAVNYCLEEAFIEPDELDAVVFYDNPLLSFDRVLKSLLSVAPKGEEQWLQASASALGVKLFIARYIRRALKADVKVLFTRHHLSHAASAFYPSPFEAAAVLTIDGVGEWATTSISRGEGPVIKPIDEIHYPHSLGLLYSAFTYHCGFKVNSGEYKLMGLAPYGTPRYADRIRDRLIHVKRDGSFRLDLDYFGFLETNRMTNERFDALFDGPARKPESRITRREMDIAASIQQVTEEVMLGLARHARDVTGLPDLCLAGGVALNCVANGVLLREKVFDRIWIQPAAGDAGGALGAALVASHRKFGVPRKAGASGRDRQSGSYLGPAYSGAEVAAFLDRHGYPHERIEDPGRRAAVVASALESGHVVGLLSGRMEFGPRSLGGRSILGDPRRADTQVQMNLKIKYRESFRPFAPSVIRERCADYFELDHESPYMLLVAPVRPERRLPAAGVAAGDDPDDLLAVVSRARSDVPAITHVDYSARVQTVGDEDNPFYRQVLEAFEARTGCAVLVNTSFNVRGEPIVCSPEDAYRCFMRTEMDVLVLEDCVLEKSKQPAVEADESWRTEYELD